MRRWRGAIIAGAILASISAIEPVEAQDSEGGERARGSVREALEALQVFRKLPEVQELTSSNEDAAHQLNNVSRSLKAAERQIDGELKLSAEGIARDMTAQLSAVTRDLKKIESLDAVLEDINALLAISTEYQARHDEWMQLRKESFDRIDRNARDYVEKLRRFQTYCPDLCDQAFHEIERTNGQTPEGRIIVTLINDHYHQSSRLTTKQVIAEVISAFEINISQ